MENGVCVYIWGPEALHVSLPLDISFPWLLPIPAPPPHTPPALLSAPFSPLPMLGSLSVVLHCILFPKSCPTQLPQGL